ncbi:MAG TPA: DUF3150 domain-containing protein [Planctomycetaceae bacterium]|nr:DUF3150 domain-containing protein [Planctomycetaceae bacterium]
MNANDLPILDALQQRGVLVSVHVRYWRGRKKLKAQDLGLDPCAVNPNLIALGQKRLVTKEALQPFSLIESRAHAFVEGASFPFLRLARFVPNERLRDVQERLAALKFEFDREAERFVAAYSEIRAEALAAWRMAATDLGVDPARLLRTIEEAFPLDVRPAFDFRWQLFQLTAPKDVTTAAFDPALNQEATAARRKAADEAREEIRRSAESFVADSVAALRGETARLCEDVMATIKSGPVNQKTLNRLDRFVERFHALNFVGDEEMDRRLSEFGAEFLELGAKDYRENAAARFQLVEGLSRLRTEATRLASEDAQDMVRRFGEVGRRKFGRAG